MLEKGKPNLGLASKVLLYDYFKFVDLVSFSFSLFIFSFFYFFYLKNGATPLHVAAFNGYGQIIQILLKKGKANVDLADQVLLIVFF